MLPVAMVRNRVLTFIFQRVLPAVRPFSVRLVQLGLPSTNAERNACLAMVLHLQFSLASTDNLY